MSFFYHPLLELGQDHRITEPFRLEKTSKITQSKLNLVLKSTTKPCYKILHLHAS